MKKFRSKIILALLALFVAGGVFAFHDRIDQDRSYFTSNKSTGKVLRDAVRGSKSFIGNKSAILKIPLKEHRGIDKSYRQNVAEQSLQIGFGAENTLIEIDIDIHNPSYSLWQQILHANEVLDTSGEKRTDPYDVNNEKFWECLNDRYIS